jgi:hypothetical protein
MTDPNKKNEGNSRHEFLRNLLGPTQTGSRSESNAKHGSTPTGSAQKPQQPSGSHAAPTGQAASAGAAAPPPRAHAHAAAPQRQKTRAELCPHCGIAIVQPQIAIVCQNCNRFVVLFRFWHGALAVALILAAAAVQASTGQPGIPVAIGLSASQLLLVFAVRPFERHLVLIIISFLLVPASVAIVSAVVGFADALPPFLQASPVWISIVAFFALSAELFVHWRRAGKQHGLSIWRILGTFSIAMSAGALMLLLTISAMPDTFVPKGSFSWQLIEHALRFRAGALLVWLAYVVLLSLPSTFGRSIDVKHGRDLAAIMQSLLHVVALARGVTVNFGQAVREGAHDIIVLGRAAIGPVARRILFLVSVIAWQVAFSLLIDSYLSYLVDRDGHLWQLAPAAFLAATAPIAIFWTVTHARLAEVVGVAARTVTLTGSLLIFCASVATLLWWAYELLSGRKEDINWIGVASIVIVVAAVLTSFAHKEKSSP